MEAIELVYSLFNQYLYQEAKNNIELIDYYFATNPSTAGNPLIDSLIDSIKKYELSAIDLPLFQSILMKLGKTPQESSKIMVDIATWKQYGKQQIAPARQFLQDVCADALIRKAQQLYQKHPSEFLKYLKNTDFKTEYNDVMNTTQFSQIDINSMIASQGNSGIESRHQWINDSYDPFKKYETGQMVMICLPPGCFKGDTLIRLIDGTNISFESLASEIKEKKTFEVFCKDENGKIKKTRVKDCWISKMTKDLVRVDYDNEKFDICTPDHKFLLVDGTYKEARTLSIGESISTKEGCTLTVEGVMVYYTAFEIPVYDLEVEDPSHNFMLSSGAFVHNCGKTLFAMGEALYMASCGHKVHFMAMGDMKPKDFVIRMGAIYSGLPFSEVQLNLGAIYNGLRQTIGENLGLTIVPAAKVSVDQYIEYIKDRDDEVLFIDYDSNFLSKASDNMYSEYGEIYDKLTELTQLGKLVFVCAQPKVGVWGNEVIQLSDVGESSRKQHSADMIITGGRVVGNPNHLGTFKIAKNRRGEEGIEQPYIRLNNGRFKALPHSVYDSLKGFKEKRHYSEVEIDALVNQYMSQFQNIQRGLNQAQQKQNGGQKAAGPF